MDGNQVLGNIDSGRAMRDPLIVPNVPHYKARIKLEAEVNQLQPPPRPANWGVCCYLPDYIYLPSCVAWMCA